jgi:hypothetical protein
VDKMQTLEAFVKQRDGNMLAICKHVVDGGDVKLTEAQFTKLATDAAQLAYPNDRPDKAFVKYFEAHQVVREAHRVVKGLALILPLQIGGQAAVDAADSDPEDALGQIMQIVEAQRARDPEMAKLSKEQAFAKIYAAHPELAARERAQNRPRA